MEDAYLELAQRNGWNYSNSDGRPYFMKDGNYAIPDETTSEEDKDILANIISEGSIEMAELIKLCWNNNIKISGPCSGIREYHDKPPFSLHFSFMAEKVLIDPLYESLQNIFPAFNHLYRESNGMIRYDIDYYLNGKELTVDESNEIFFIIKKQLQFELGNIPTRH